MPAQGSRSATVAPTTHPADVLGLRGGAQKAQTGGKGAAKPPTRLRSQSKTTTPGAIPGGGRADRGPESTPSPSGVDNSTLGRRGGAGGGKRPGVPEHDPPRLFRLRPHGQKSMRGHAQGEGAASTPSATTRPDASPPDRRHLSPQAAGVVLRAPGPQIWMTRWFRGSGPTAFARGRVSWELPRCQKPEPRPYRGCPNCFAALCFCFIGARPAATVQSFRLSGGVGRWQAVQLYRVPFGIRRGGR